jgi:hypothetical protein
MAVFPTLVSDYPIGKGGEEPQGVGFSKENHSVKRRTST